MANSAKPPGTLVIAVVVAATMGLVFGFQLANWTAAPGTGPASAGAGQAHSHPLQAVPGAEVSGLSVSAGGYTMVPEVSSFTPAAAGTLRFGVRGPDGELVREYATVHEKKLHLIVARRDLTGYQHLHPILDSDGVWSTPLTLATPGMWRAFADFAVVGANGGQIAMTLGIDLTVVGAYAPTALPNPARSATVGDLTVTYDGTPRAGTSVPITFRAHREGSVTATIEPYLGAAGHLIVLREGDVGYIHAHADPPSSNSEVRFWLTAPSPGRYRMFLDIKVAGTVHTAEFTVSVAAA